MNDACDKRGKLAIYMIVWFVERVKEEEKKLTKFALELSRKKRKIFQKEKKLVSKLTTNEK